MEMASIGRMLVGMGRFAAPCRFLRKDSSSLVGVLAGLTATVGLVAVAFSLLSSFFFFLKCACLWLTPFHPVLSQPARVSFCFPVWPGSLQARALLPFRGKPCGCSPIPPSLRLRRSRACCGQ